MEQKKFILLKIVFIFLALVSGLSILAAGDQVAFAELDGIEPPKWTRSLPADPCPGTSDTNCHWGSPVLAYIDGDDYLDIVAVTNKGRVIAVRHDSTLLWDKDIASAFGM
jgi:hypothetical protein